jgi:hypothetical protein
MNEIENLIKAEIALARENMIFQLLGQFGDRLPKDVQNEMREEAEFESRTRKKLKKRVENSCK